MASTSHTSRQNTSPDKRRPHVADEGNEIVISGMSARFPYSSNVAEYGESLYDDVDIIDETKRHSKSTQPGTSKDHDMDVQYRMILEETYRAITDAGVNPASICGTKTGVYIVSRFSEKITSKTSADSTFTTTGVSRMYANRISYCLGITGPCQFVDAAGSSSMHAIDCAYNALRNGEIDAAIVGGSSLIPHPNSVPHVPLFAETAKPVVPPPCLQYANFENVAVLYLQRRCHARRIYATLVHSKSNPPGIVKEKLLRDFYDKLNICSNDIGYIEVHSTGTGTGNQCHAIDTDYQYQCHAIDTALCSQRSEPLLVGSVDSNLGYTEPTSGFYSVIKVIHIFQTGKIPESNHFDTSAHQGRLKIVNEITELKKPYVGINSIGLGGAHAHILLKQYEKKKVNIENPKGSLPTLFLWSGRTSCAVEKVFHKLESKSLDPEYIALLQKVQAGGIPSMMFRGYSIHKDKGTDKPNYYLKDVQHYSGMKTPIVYVYSGLGSQWTGMGSALMVIPTFRQSIQMCHNVLSPLGVDLMTVLTSNDPKTFDNIMHSFVGIAAIQIGLTDILKSLGIEPDYIIGLSTGELGCAYADNCFTVEQVMLAAYYRGLVSSEKQDFKGSMVAVGMSYQSIRSIIPESIEVACHNCPEACTISGPADDVAQFSEQLKQQNIFVKDVPCANVAYHTRYISHLRGDFLKHLKLIVPNPKKRSAKWLSTSVPEKDWSLPEAALSSAEYHTNNLLNNVLFQETAALLPKNVLTMEISPHCLLRSILQSCLPNATHLTLTRRNEKDNHIIFQRALGKLHLNGINIPVEVLYPEIELPVSRGTDTISDIIDWNHSDDWKAFSGQNKNEKSFYIDMTAEEFKYLEGYNIDGKVLVPATFYLECVLKTFAHMNNELDLTTKTIEMEHVQFKRTTTLTAERKVQIDVIIHYATGNFEVLEGESLLAIGVVRQIEEAVKPVDIITKQFDNKYGEEFSMSTKDFYKELKLRGYYYTGDFQAVESMRGDGQVARLKWNSNLVSFMECMLQTRIVSKDSRDLCLPSRISKIRIFGHHHMTAVSNKNYVDVYTYNSECRIVGGGVELIGMEISNFQRRKPPGFPIQERYLFVPHYPAPPLRLDDISRLCIQLILENNALSNLKFVEIIPKAKMVPIVGDFLPIIKEIPLITGEYTILSTKTFKDLPTGITVKTGDVLEYIHSSNIIDQTGGDVLKHANKLADGLFMVLMVKEEKKVTVPKELSVLAVCPWITGQKLVLLQKNGKAPLNEVEVLKISSSDSEFQWLEQAQQILSSKDLILVAENDKFSGILGLTNCLRKEYNKSVVRCVLIDDPKAPAFNIKDSFYAKQLKRGMAINVYRNGLWGTYRHLALAPHYLVMPYGPAAYLDIVHRGDISSLKWFGAQKDVSEYQIKIVYSGLNLKDVMLATGQISVDVVGESRLQQICFLGMEYSGIDIKTEKEVMGIVEKTAVASHMEWSDLTMNVPKKWTLCEAASVPVAYFTVYYAFFFCTDIRKGKSIFINASTDGIGLAAIRTALAYGLKVFTTVSTKEERKYLLETFPQLKESHIGNSGDTSFKTVVQNETNGKGVDFVLNSLSEENRIASLKCLARGGVFLEIGKVDFTNNLPIEMSSCLKELSFVSVLLESALNRNNVVLRKELCDLISKDIENDIIQPIPTTIFRAKKFEYAFRLFCSGAYRGKVLIQMRRIGDYLNTLPIQVFPQVYFPPELVYVVPGGLGDFGLELVDWMVLRGARNIVLSSSCGVTNGYQSYRIHIWKSYGCKVNISTANICTKCGCETLIKSAMTLGPIGGIFSMAMVLKDAIFENQSAELFKESVAPKVLATMYLDELTRQLCPKLQHFVVFSSVSCRRGKASQTNYGMANSIMERIIEDRFANGFPGKAFEFGAVDDVCIAEDKIDLESDGLLQRRILLCLPEIDSLLSCPDPLVASMVVDEECLDQTDSKSLFERILNIMRIRDAKLVPSYLTLSQVGMDPQLAVEIKNTIERDFDICFSPRKLRSMTVANLRKYSHNLSQKDAISKFEIRPYILQSIKLVCYLGDEAKFQDIIVPINEGKEGKSPIFFFSGLECASGQIWIDLGKHIQAPSYVIQMHNTIGIICLDEIVQFALEQIISMLKPGENFHIVGYSFGSIIVSKVTHLLEKLGHKGKIFLIDGSPWLVQTLIHSWMDMIGRDYIENVILSHIVKLLHIDVTEEQCRNYIQNMVTMVGRLMIMQEYTELQTTFSAKYIIGLSVACHQRMHMVTNMDISDLEKINAPICLVKSEISGAANLPNDYNLGPLSNNPIVIKELKGDHSTILQNPKLPALINKFLLSDETSS